MPRVTNKGKATTAGAIGGATSAWLAYEAQRKFGVPVEVAGEVIAIFAGAIGALISRWSSKLDPHE